MLTLTLDCQRLSAALPPLNKDLGPYTCATREQKELMLICLEQRESCHQMLENAEHITMDDWPYFAVAGLTGAVLGAVLATNLKH